MIAERDFTMYLIFDRSNGVFTRDSIHGVERRTQAADSTIRALEFLKVGEYCYVGENFVVSRVTYGFPSVAIDTLRWRAEASQLTPLHKSMQGA